MDFNVTLNPFRTFVQIGRDKAWRKLTSTDITPKDDWIIPVAEFDSTPAEDLTVHYVSRKVDMNQNDVKEWPDMGLEELKIKAAHKEPRL